MLTHTRRGSELFWTRVIFDELFTRDKPVIFAFHAYPWLIHRLTYRRATHNDIHVRGYKEEEPSLRRSI